MLTRDKSGSVRDQDVTKTGYLCLRFLNLNLEMDG
jgi:hypothetical protein